MKINDVQLANFKAICERNGEFMPIFTDNELRSNVNFALRSQGYWSGMSLKYYLDGDDWKTEARQFGSQ